MHLPGLLFLLQSSLTIIIIIFFTNFIYMCLVIAPQLLDRYRGDTKTVAWPITKYNCSIVDRLPKKHHVNNKLLGESLIADRSKGSGNFNGPSGFINVSLVLQSNSYVKEGHGRRRLRNTYVVGLWEKIKDAEERRTKEPAVVNWGSKCEESLTKSRVVRSRELSCRVVISCKLLVASCKLST